MEHNLVDILTGQSVPTQQDSIERTRIIEEHDSLYDNHNSRTNL